MYILVPVSVDTRSFRIRKRRINKQLNLLHHLLVTRIPQKPDTATEREICENPAWFLDADIPMRIAEANVNGPQRSG